MFQRKIGKLERPLENLLIEETELNGTREVHFTIATSNLFLTKPILEEVAERFTTTTDGKLYAEDNKGTSFSFPLSFDNYLKEFRENREPLFIIISPLLNGGYAGIIANINSIKAGKTLEFYCAVTINGIIESLCPVGNFKFNHPLAKESINQGILGYRIKGKEKDFEQIDRLKENILDVVSRNKEIAVPLTLTQVAVMNEVLLEVDYHTHRVLRSDQGGSGGHVLQIIPRGPKGPMCN